MLEIVAQITVMSTAPRSGTIRHDAFPAVARESRGAAGGDAMMSVALLRGNTQRVAAPFQAVQLLHETKKTAASFIQGMSSQLIYLRQI
jgi:hypothetical protein